MCERMYKFVLFCIFNLIATVNSVHDGSEIDSDIHFICGSSKYLSKCGCGRETDKFRHIPLFTVDCSRLGFKSCPQNKILPLLMGHLDLSHNKIEYLNETTALFSDTLQYLDISYNKIKSISHGYFKNVNRLRYLNLEHNQLENIELELFDGLKELTTLNLKSNELKTLPQGIFSELNSLNELMLSHNDLGKFLEDVKLIDYMPESTMSLYLDNINLKNIKDQLFNKMYHLKKLSIGHNNLQTLPHLLLNFLEYLDISSTNVSVLLPEILNFPNLNILKLNRLPHLTNISEFTFYHLKMLEVLEIQNCMRLQEIDPLAFGFLKLDQSNQFKLKKLSLSYNGLTTLNYSFESIFGSLEEINLSGNNWNCDCKLKWIKNLKKVLKDNTETKCSTPEEQTNKIISELNNEDLSCFTEKDFSTANVSIRNWLFALVGILTLIVIGLVGLLIYMGPYGDYLYSGSKTIGPESPYSQITIQPNRAEYSDAEDGVCRQNGSRY